MNGLEMKYFVLKPRGSDAYAVASRAALESYASAICDANPNLSRELREWATSETNLDRIVRQTEGFRDDTYRD